MSKQLLIFNIDLECYTFNSCLIRDEPFHIFFCGRTLTNQEIRWWREIRTKEEYQDLYNELRELSNKYEMIPVSRNQIGKMIPPESIIELDFLDRLLRKYVNKGLVTKNPLSF